MHGERSSRGLVDSLVEIIDIFGETLIAICRLFMVFLKLAVNGILPPARVATIVSAVVGAGLLLYGIVTGDISNTLITFIPGRAGDYLHASTNALLPVVTGAFHLAEETWATGLFFDALLGLVGGLLIALAPAERRKRVRHVVRKTIRVFRQVWGADWCKWSVRSMTIEVVTTHAS